MSALAKERKRLERRRRARARRAERERAGAETALRAILASESPGSPRWRNAERGLRRRGITP